MKILDLTNVFIFWIGSSHIETLINIIPYGQSFYILFCNFCMWMFVSLIFTFPHFSFFFMLSVYVCLCLYGKGMWDFSLFKISNNIYLLFFDGTKEKERISIIVMYTSALLHMWMRYYGWVLNFNVHFNITYRFTVFDLIS